MIRMIKAGLRYWSFIGSFENEGEARIALLAFNMRREHEKRIAKRGNGVIRNSRIMLMDTDWEKDSFPDAVQSRRERLANYERIAI